MDSFALFQMLLRQYLEAGGVITYDYNYIFMSRATVKFNGKRGKKYATPARFRKDQAQMSRMIEFFIYTQLCKDSLSGMLFEFVCDS